MTTQILSGQTSADTADRGWRPTFRRLGRLAVALTILLTGTIGCLPKHEREVIVYCALDKEFSEPILDDYAESADVVVLPKYDIESTKTVGLVTALISERNRPRCDLFWNNEILHTLRLERMGLLETYISPAAEAFPSDYVSSDGNWHGLAARARILIVNTDLLPDEASRPTSVEELADPKWKGRVAMAKPSHGTTATHVAVWFSRWGAERTQEFLRGVKENAAILSGNRQVAQGVARGDFAFGITDTDDAIVEIERGAPVAIIFPDQAAGEAGALFVPNTLCILKDCPNPEQAKRLVDHLLSSQVEERLAVGPSAQFPVNPEVLIQSRAAPEQPVRWMDVDFAKASESWDESAAFVNELFQAVD